jgi:hypothetical protein
VAATADPRHRDYFKPDFFNGIGRERKPEHGRGEVRFRRI